MDGWFKIHRKITEKGFYKNSYYIHLWYHLILRANYEEKEIMWNGKPMKIRRGMFVTGRKRLSEETGIPESTIERALKYFENEHQIEQQKTTKYRVITILNYETHQMLDIKTDNRRTTDGQQTDTSKEYKKNKKGYSSSAEAPRDPPTLLQGKEWQEYIDLFSTVNPMYLEIYKNTTERAALDSVARAIGKEKLKRTLEALPELTSLPMAPRISRPSELKRDLGKLIIFYNQERAKSGNKIKNKNEHAL